MDSRKSISRILDKSGLEVVENSDNLRCPLSGKATCGVGGYVYTILDKGLPDFQNPEFSQRGLHRFAYPSKTGPCPLLGNRIPKRKEILTVTEALRKATGASGGNLAVGYDLSTEVVEGEFWELRLYRVLGSVR